MILPIQTKIEVESDLQAVDLVLQQFNRIYNSRISEQDWLQCQLALVEGFTNAVRHAHKDLPPETSITIAITLYLGKAESAIHSEKITICIWDYGKPFNLKHFINTISKQNKNWQGSGRGIAIMYKIADEISYKRVSQTQNCLEIVKYLDN